MKPLHLSGVVLAIADLSAEGYYHWLLENLPRIGMALGALKEDPVIDGLRIWHNAGDRPYVREGLLDILGLSADRLIDAHHHPYIRADRLLVPSFPSDFGWPSAQVRTWLRTRFLPEPSTMAAEGRIWLKRSDSGRRPIWRQQDCIERLLPLGFRAFDPASCTIREQARRIASASCIAAPHGAALANLVFAAPGTTVLEAHQTGYAPPYFHALAAQGRLLLARCEQPEVPPPLHRSLLFEGPSVEPIVMDPARVERATAALLELGSEIPSGAPSSTSLGGCVL